MSKKVKWIYDPVLMQNYYLITDADSKSVAQFIKKQFSIDYFCDDGWNGKCIEILDEDNLNRGVVIAIRTSIKNAPVFMSELAHECVHAGWFTISSRKIKIDESCHEVQAYIVQYLVREFLKCLKIRE